MSSETLKHLCAMVKVNPRFLGQYFPLVQQIINYTMYGSIDTQPGRVSFLGYDEVSDSDGWLVW